MEEVTERKPRGMSFPTWIDQQIADAEQRGVFDDLPGKGKPLNLKPTGGDYGDAWVRDYARREGVQPDEFLPTPLRLRREIEQLTEVVGEFRSEAEIREVAADINRRIVEWRRIPVGPPIHVRLVNADDLVARWRAAPRPARRPPARGRRPARDRPAAAGRRGPGGRAGGDADGGRDHPRQGSAGERTVAGGAARGAPGQRGSDVSAASCSTAPRPWELAASASALSAEQARGRRWIQLVGGSSAPIAVRCADRLGQANYADAARAARPPRCQRGPPSTEHRRRRRCGMAAASRPAPVTSAGSWPRAHGRPRKATLVTPNACRRSRPPRSGPDAVAGRDPRRRPGSERSRRQRPSATPDGARRTWRGHGTPVADAGCGTIAVTTRLTALAGAPTAAEHPTGRAAGPQGRGRGPYGTQVPAGACRPAAHTARPPLSGRDARLTPSESDAST